MYYLMNKDAAVLEFDVDKSGALFDDIVFKEGHTFGNLPFGFKNINSWLENRKASKHSNHLKVIMANLGCDDNEGFIRVTHAASINDTFWVKRDNDNSRWSDISLYRNEFTEVISQLAFEGVGLYDTIFSSSSPELACDGSYRKCFRKEHQKGEFGSDIYIYKRGSEIAKIEPYCEMLASEIAKIISPNNSVSYETVSLHGKTASKCNLFTNERVGYSSYSKMADSSSFTDVFRFFEALGSEQSFREMAVIDSLCFNQDRHMGNYGVLFDNDTIEVIKMAPVFDMNISMFAYASDISNVGDILFDYFPKLGNDFTRMGQIALNDLIKDRVKNLKDFSFSFRGDDFFSAKRVKTLETIIQKQAAALLSPEKMYTKDVFVSAKYKEFEKRQETIRKAVETAQKFLKVADDISLTEGTFISECIDTGETQGRASAEITFENGSYAISIDFLREKCRLLYNMADCGLDKIQNNRPDFYSDYVQIKKALTGFDDSLAKRMFKSQATYSITQD